MDYLKLQTNNFFLKGKINITGSKSESNRLLILKALYPNIINIKNLSNSDDTYFLKKALFTTKKVININHSGTAMRFLTAFFSIKKNKEILLTGSYRMQERPIYILVETLKKLGGKIFYENKNGYPPLRIIGSNFLGGTISIDANLSSQYISAILLIASQFKNGLKIFLSKKITSLSYIKMTFKILKKIGINVYCKQNIIIINNNILKQKKILIESDWSSASYYYSLVAFCKKAKAKANLNLKFFTKKSIQGDKVITNIYNSFFNVKTFFKQKKFILKNKIIKRKKKYIFIDLNSTPDIAQTIVVTCAGLKIKCFLTGLETLKIKETDRLKALKIELFKLGIKSIKTNNSLLLNNFNFKKKNLYIYTYDDHRMAMSFSTLSIIYPISILDPYVVYKSYPNFWIDLKKLGFFFKTKQL
ncbi:MAG: 3-phosphoshikimate 1-carboxyvinyltransferase [Candidatus Karelsulcia muelleri]